MTAATTLQNSITFPAARHPELYVQFMRVTGANKENFPVTTSYLEIVATETATKISLHESNISGSTPNVYAAMEMYTEPSATVSLIAEKGDIRNPVVLESNGGAACTRVWFNKASGALITDRGSNYVDGYKVSEQVSSEYIPARLRVSWQSDCEGLFKIAEQMLK